LGLRAGPEGKNLPKFAQTLNLVLLRKTDSAFLELLLLPLLGFCSHRYVELEGPLFQVS